MTLKPLKAGLSAMAILLATSSTAAWAEELFYVTGAVGNAVANLKETVKPWEAATGNTVTVVTMPACASAPATSAPVMLDTPPR